MRTFSVLVAFLVIAAAPRLSQAEARVESNVVYGMYSGLALLMDVHYPEQSNGYGIIHISGTAWTRPLSYNAGAHTQEDNVEREAIPLVEAGYTIFTINHRSTPRFQYPAPVEDAQRAVRFIRYHASEFGIDPDQIGAMGGSSGGHLVSMLGVLDGVGDSNDPDPINRVSSKVQCVVGRAVPAYFPAIDSTRGTPYITMLLGTVPSDDAESEEGRRYISASPITYTSADDPPFLLLHGDEDDVIPFAQAGLLSDALH